MGEILIFSSGPGPGPGPGDAYPRPAPTPAPHALFEIYFIKIYNLISINTYLFSYIITLKKHIYYNYFALLKKFIKYLIINIIIVFCCNEKVKKKCIFLKYFIKNRVFAGGVRAGPGDLSPLEAGLGVQFLPPI